MLIKIVKCEPDSSDASRITWYQDLINLLAEVELTGNGYYRVLNPWWIRGQYIEIDDCEEVKQDSELTETELIKS